MRVESPGTLIGSYEVIQHLEGQSSEVYLARRHGGDSKRQFILVVVEVRADDAAQIREEVDRCQKLDHPGLVGVVEMFDHGAKHVLVFDSMPGTNLRRLMDHFKAQGERLADSAVYHVAYSLFAALGQAHLFKNEDDKIEAIVHGQLGHTWCSCPGVAR